MNNTTHTPGPLKAVQIIIENSPCTWAVQRKSIREQWGKPSIATYIDNEADARLFAAAPAMYEALQWARQYLRMPNFHPDNSYNSEQWARDYNKLTDALAQAEGHQHG